MRVGAIINSLLNIIQTGGLVTQFSAHRPSAELDQNIQRDKYLSRSYYKNLTNRDGLLQRLSLIGFYVQLNVVVVCNYSFISVQISDKETL